MRSRIAVFTALVALLSVAPGLAKASKSPTRAQMRSAVSRVKRSRNLWATVNICDTKRHPNMIGVRGQIPALGFRASLSLTVRLEYYSTKAAAFKSIPHVQSRIALGNATTGFHQGGAIFTFKPPVASLEGVVTFRWRVGKQLLGQATRVTGHGYKGVDHGDPPGTSHAVCRIS